MRNLLILLAPLLLAGCVDGSASYVIDGNDQALTLHAQQEYFWNDQVTLRLTASRLPDCQRQLVLGKVPAADLDVELFADGDNGYLLRAGGRQWQVETQDCNLVGSGARAAPAQPLGSFYLDDHKELVFEPASAVAAR